MTKVYKQTGTDTVPPSRTTLPSGEIVDTQYGDLNVLKDGSVYIYNEPGEWVPTGKNGVMEVFVSGKIGVNEPGYGYSAETPVKCLSYAFTNLIPDNFYGMFVINLDAQTNTTAYDSTYHHYIGAHDAPFTFTHAMRKNIAGLYIRGVYPASPYSRATSGDTTNAPTGTTFSPPYASTVVRGHIKFYCNDLDVIIRNLNWYSVASDTQQITTPLIALPDMTRCSLQLYYCSLSGNWANATTGRATANLVYTYGGQVAFISHCTFRRTNTASIASNGGIIQGYALGWENNCVYGIHTMNGGITAVANTSVTASTTLMRKNNPGIVAHNGALA